MGEINIQDLLIMIEEYSDEKANLAGAEAKLSGKQEVIAVIEELIHTFGDIALYEGVLRKLVEMLGTAREGEKQAAEELAKAAEKAAGFEKRKTDTIEDIKEQGKIFE